jgi:transcriptional regulator of acetoin/glycerol metabolism
MAKRTRYGAVKDAVKAIAHPLLTAEMVADQTGHNVRSVRWAIKHLGLPVLRERRLKGSVKDLVTAAHAQGMTVPQLAETSGVSRHTLYSVFKRLNLTPCRGRRGRPTL